MISRRQDEMRVNTYSNKIIDLELFENSSNEFKFSFADPRYV